MSSEHPYGAEKVRSSLIHFVVGKGATAAIGFALLLLVVRALPQNEYGVYIALLAVLEIVLLASNLGLIAAAYRYVPELRSQNQGSELHRLLRALSIARLATLLATIGLAFVFVDQIVGLLDLDAYRQVFYVYGLVIVAEGYARYLDVLFDSLLLQRYSQLALLARNGLRLGGLIVALATQQHAVSLADWAAIELFASLIGAAISTLLLFNFSRRTKRSFPGSRNEQPIYRRYLNFAGPNYLAQVVSLVYGPETTKLILTKLGGALQVGAFGFAASISGMLQRYLPVFLLLGLVRPLFVSANGAADRNARLNLLASIVLKLNLFVLFPAVAYVLAAGDQLAGILSGGKFPDSGSFLLVFVILLVFQTWHAVLGLLAMAIEDGISGFHGTLLGLLGLLAGVALLPAYGPYSLCIGLVLSEIIWCLFVLLALNKKGFKVLTDWAGIAKLAAFSVAGFLAAESVRGVFTASSALSTLIDFVVVCTTFVVVAALIKPFTSEERGMINRILPRPLFIW